MIKIKWEPEYFIFKYLMLIALSPKIFQLFLFFALSLLILKSKKFKLKLGVVEISVLVFIFSYFVSILLNIFTEYSSYRFFATVNNLVVWILVVIFYNYYSTINLDIKKIGKYLSFNILILFIFSVIHIFNPPYFFNIIISIIDYVGGVSKYRFIAGFEYSNLVVTFYLVCIIFLYNYLTNCLQLNNLFVSVCLLASISPVYFSNSRIGIILAFILTVVLFLNLYNIRYKILFVITFIPFLVFVFLEYNTIIEKINELIWAREASSITRFGLYKESFDVYLETTLLFGNGIKTMYQNVPLASHSTYLGTLFKSGLIGLIALISSFLNMVKNTLKISGRDRNIYIVFFLLIFTYFLFEDIDGSNWSVILMFSMFGIFTNKYINI